VNYFVRADSKKKSLHARPNDMKLRTEETTDGQPYHSGKS
jgi:hypothetical protein